jgi:hypothetical protein
LQKEFPILGSLSPQTIAATKENMASAATASPTSTIPQSLERGNSFQDKENSGHVSRASTIRSKLKLNSNSKKNSSDFEVISFFHFFHSSSSSSSVIITNF